MEYGVCGMEYGVWGMEYWGMEMVRIFTLVNIPTAYPLHMALTHIIQVFLVLAVLVSRVLQSHDVVRDVGLVLLRLAPIVTQLLPNLLLLLLLALHRVPAIFVSFRTLQIGVKRKVVRSG
jgi:hypothetical protein